MYTTWCSWLLPFNGKTFSIKLKRSLSNNLNKYVPEKRKLGERIHRIKWITSLVGIVVKSENEKTTSENLEVSFNSNFFKLIVKLELFWESTISDNIFTFSSSTKRKSISFLSLARNRSICSMFSYSFIHLCVWFIEISHKKHFHMFDLPFLDAIERFIQAENWVNQSESIIWFALSNDVLQIS